MIKRPVFVGAVFFAAVIWLCSMCGVSDGIPRTLSAVSGDTLQVWGRVASREETAGGTRLYIEHFSFISKDNLISNQSTSEEKSGSKENSDSKENSSSKENSGSENNWMLLAYLQAENNDFNNPESGDWVLLQGKCTLPDQASNPGQFDSRGYYFARKTALIMRNGNILRLQKGAAHGRSLLAELENRLADSMKTVFGAEDAALISAITLGDRSGLSGEIRRLYQEGGIAHILAVSSLHITLVCMGVYRIARKTGSLLFSGVFSGIFAFLFCQMTGMSVSALRALIMFLVWLGSQAAGRTCDRLTSAAVAAVFILAASPRYLRDSGFQLSFGCVLTLTLLLPAAEKLFPVKNRLGKAWIASCVLQIGTLPVVMHSFYQITPYAPLINLAVVPCMSLVMVSGLAGGLAGLVSPAAGTVLAAPCHYLLRLFELLCRLERKLPGAVIITGCPSGWKIAVYYGLLSVICIAAFYGMGNRGAFPAEKILNRIRIAGRQKKTGMVLVYRFGTAVILMAAILLLGSRSPCELRITFLDVGQGDGILLEAGDFTCLIDGGSSSVDQVWQYRIENTLKYYGISRFDAVFLSHGDQDHISGIQEMLEKYEENLFGVNVGGITLGKLVFPDTGYEDEKLETLASEAAKHSIAVEHLKAGGGIRMGSLQLSCLSPSPENSVGDSNQDSMVLFLKYGDFSALFTGDLEKEGEQMLLERYGSRVSGVTLLKVGHHGSKYGTSEAFLSVLSPRAAVISCGKNNRYGHPAEELLERLNRYRTKIFRTDQDGAVTVWMERGQVRVKAYTRVSDADRQQTYCR